MADDDPDVLSLLALNLESEGYRVETATDGEQAWTVALQAVPEVVVLDVMMPERDGFDVLASLKEHPRTKDIPVVLLSAKAADTDVWQGWKAGADYYITKPFDMDELMRFLGRLCERPRSTETAAD